jgi:nicotinamide phosphoribosyltransferase
MKINPLFATDFYKVGHIKQYPNGTEVVYSNFTPRSNSYAPKSEVADGKIVVFGVQGFIQQFLINTWNENFFSLPKEEVVTRYKTFIDKALCDDVNVSHIEALHDLGYLPLCIKALPEGSVVNPKIPVVTVVNTLPEFFWLSNYIETVLSNELWKPMTVASIARQYRMLLEKYAEDTGSPKEFVSWQGHDFSARGMSGMYDVSAASAGHLVSFLGTDSISAMDYLEQYYNASESFIGGSVAATEHSVMCMGGKETEIETFRRLIEDVYPSGIVSIVSDTWDFFGVVGKGGLAEQLKDKILARQSNPITGLGKVVFRPDSGDPVKIICGLKVAALEDIDIDNYYQFDVVEKDGKYYKFEVEICSDDWCNHLTDVEITDEVSENEVKGAVECLWDTFGGTTTDKGYKVLHERVGLIYGDSITLGRAQDILRKLKEKGFASCNIVFGIGSFTYQHITRDTYGFAMKATYGVVNGEARELFKDPITDNGTKKSAKGLLRVEKVDGEYVLYDRQDDSQEQSGELRPVFLDGQQLVNDSLDNIRQRLVTTL